MRVLLAAILLLQAAPAQPEADKLEAALKKFGDRSYRITEKGKEAGTLSLKTRVDGEGERKRAVFEDRIAVKIGELDGVNVDLVMTLTETASLNGLWLLRGTRSGTAPGGKVDMTVSIREGDAYVKADDRMLVIRDAQAAVGEQAVLRLVCSKEQKVGAAFKADVLVLKSETFDEGHEFRCVAKETLDVGGARREAFKWEEKWEGATIRSRDVTRKVDNAYWVSPDGYLVRFTSGKTEMTLDSK